MYSALAEELHRDLHSLLAGGAGQVSTTAYSKTTPTLVPHLHFSTLLKSRFQCTRETAGTPYPLVLPAQIDALR